MTRLRLGPPLACRKARDDDRDEFGSLIHLNEGGPS